MKKRVVNLFHRHSLKLIWLNISFWKSWKWKRNEKKSFIFVRKLFWFVFLLNIFHISSPFSLNSFLNFSLLVHSNYNIHHHHNLMCVFMCQQEKFHRNNFLIINSTVFLSLIGHEIFLWFFEFSNDFFKNQSCLGTF